MNRKPLKMQVKNLDIQPVLKERLAKYANCSVEEFLLRTGGKNYAQGIGLAGERAISLILEEHGVVIEEFLKGSVHELPSKLKLLFLKHQIYWVKDIDLDRIELLQMLEYNYRKFLLIEKMLIRSGIQVRMPEQDSIIYDTSLSPRAKNALYKNGYPLLSSLADLTDESIVNFQNVGTVTAEEIIRFRDAHMGRQADSNKR